MRINRVLSEVSFAIDAEWSILALSHFGIGRLVIYGCRLFIAGMKISLPSFFERNELRPNRYSDVFTSNHLGPVFYSVNFLLLLNATYRIYPAVRHYSDFFFKFIIYSIHRMEEYLCEAS